MEGLPQLFLPFWFLRSRMSPDVLSVPGRWILQAK